MGVRLGPNASGEITDYANSVTHTPPALQGAGVREVMNFMHAQCQIAPSPPPMTTDASSGVSRMAYRSAYVATNLREAGKFAAIRPAGATSRAHSPSRQDAGQRGEAGSCSCCTGARHAAAPPPYALGDFDWLKSRGAASRKAQGQWARRRVAARNVARSYGRLSENWDRAAQSLFMSAPEPHGDSIACALYFTNPDFQSCPSGSREKYS